MSQYILGESERETERLKVQARHDPIEQRASWAGLRPGMRVVDAGCGPGETTRVLARLAGAGGSVHGFDLSEARIASARAAGAEAGAAPVTYGHGSVFEPPLAAGSADFVFCQFVIEYLAKPVDAIRALAGLLKPGGILCVVDADPIGAINFPEPPLVRSGLDRMIAALAPTGFDPQSGRKLFSYALAAGLGSVDALVQPLVVAGRAPRVEKDNWTQRLESLKPVGIVALGSPEAYAEFTGQYLDMLENPGTMSVTNIIAIRGLRT